MAGRRGQEGEGLLHFLFLARKQNLMAGALVNKNGRDAPKHRNQGDQPPSETDHADLKAVSVPRPRENGSDGAEGGRHGLPDAVNRLVNNPVAQLISTNVRLVLPAIAGSKYSIAR